jgi:hypothetical protein
MTVRRTRRLLATAACAAAALPLAGASSAAAATCSGLGKYPGQGYFTSLKVTGISCSGGKAVMRGHYRCRTKKGIRGKCPSFNGWRCSEKRQAIPTEYNARVTCTKGSRKVVYTYQQDT